MAAVTLKFLNTRKGVKSLFVCFFMDAFMWFNEALRKVKAVKVLLNLKF